MAYTDYKKIVIDTLKDRLSVATPADLVSLDNGKDVYSLKFDSYVWKIPAEDLRLVLDKLKVDNFIKDYGFEFHTEHDEFFNDAPHTILTSIEILIPSVAIEMINNFNVDKPEHTSKFPKNMKWQDITVRFFDGHAVDIFVLGEHYKSDFIEMGFEDHKSRRPNVQWQLLEKLANMHGSISWQYKMSADSAFKKRKQILSDNLKKFFGIEDDPFEEYYKAKAYTAKFTLVPVGGSAKTVVEKESKEKDIFDGDPLKDEDW